MIRKAELAVLVSVLLCAAPLVNAQNKEWSCDYGTTEKALVKKLGLGEKPAGSHGNKCMHIRENLTTPDADKVKSIVVKNATSLATVCPFKIERTPKVDPACRVGTDSLLEANDLVQVTHLGRKSNIDQFLLTIIRNGDVVLSDTLEPVLVSGDAAWLKGEDDEHVYVVFLLHELDTSKHLEKRHRIEIFDKEANGTVKCAAHVPDETLGDRACDSFDAPVVVRIYQGTTGSGGEPPPNGK